MFHLNLFTGRSAASRSRSHLDEVVCQARQAGQVGEIAEKLRVFAEADLDAIQQLSNGAHPLLLSGTCAVRSRGELLQSFIQGQLAALQTLLEVLQLQQRVLERSKTCQLWRKTHATHQGGHV